MKLKFLLLLSVLLFVSCGSDDESPSRSSITDAQNLSTDVITSTFIDHLVEGLGYKGLSSGKSGVTNADGQFECQRGENMEFSIGKFVLGQGVCSDVMTPLSLESDPYQALKIGIVLMNLDFNSDPADGIRISPPLQTQEIYQGHLSDLIYAENSVSEIRNAFLSILANAPENSFRFKYMTEDELENATEQELIDYYTQDISYQEIGLGSARDHYSRSFVPMGRYQGEVKKLSVNLPEGECTHRKFLRAQVGPKYITFPGFAGLNQEEASFKIPRKIQPDKDRNFFNKRIDLAGYISPDSDEVIAPRLYDRAIIKGNIKDDKMVANFKFGKVLSDGSFQVHCAGKAVLVKDEKAPIFYKAVKLASSIAPDIAAARAVMIAAGGRDSEVIDKMEHFQQESFPKLYDCLFKNSITKETAYICADLKNDFDIKIKEIADFMAKRKASNPLFPQEAVDLTSKAYNTTLKINQLMFD